MSTPIAKKAQLLIDAIDEELKKGPNLDPLKTLELARRSLAMMVVILRTVRGELNNAAQD